MNAAMPSSSRTPALSRPSMSSSTSPSTRTAQLAYGVGIGALTVLIRLKGGYPEGICYAILLMNPLSTVLDGWFKPKRFAPPLGGEK